MQRLRRCLIGGLAAVILSGAPTVSARDADTQPYDLAAQDLKYALRAVTRQAGYDLVAAADLLEGRRAAILKGRFTPQEAIARLLANTDLVAQIVGRTVYIRRRQSPHGAAASDTGDATGTDRATDDLIVTGSLIRGAPSASPTLTLSRDQMARAGQADLGQVSRSIPQNFSGGQNPGVGLTTPVASGENVGSGSTINLRGLGQDATLTLLNGHRLANGGSRQSVDVASIPLAAVERIEIVADGASALYGSDAVAGVANIILRRDFDGVETSARLAAATDGGAEQQQYSLLAGRTWRSGGFIAAYQFRRDTAIEAEQRSYTRRANPGLTLYPFLKRHSVFLSGHQAITDRLSVSIDALYDWRADRRHYAIAAAAASPRYDISTRTSSFFIAPSLEWKPGGGWRLALTTSYGFDRSRSLQRLTVGPSTTTALKTCLCNSARSVEIKSDGPLFALPAGSAKIAIGAGYRRDAFHDFTTVSSVPRNVDAAQSNYFAYGELNLPLIAPTQNSPFGHRLFLNAALRYEDYPRVDRVASPKLGLVYEPTPDVALKASWGKSFKAPTLFQRYNGQTVQVNPAAIRGGTSYPPDATVLLITGGRPDLDAERATSWSVTLEAHPRAVVGLNVQLGYFEIRYRDRVLAPITFVTQSLSNPAYAPLINRDPSTTEIAEVIAGRDFFNLVPAPFDPAKVVAIIDDRNLNVATQHIRGIDLAIAYETRLGNDDRLTFTAQGSYLDSRQRLNPVDPATRLAGTYFNPPHFRGRAGVGWSHGTTDLTAFVNHVGGVDDTRFATADRIGGMTTLDLAARIRVEGPGPLRGVEVTLAAENILNAKPDRARSSAVYDPAYDSTNYSPIGRLVSIGVRKQW